MMIKQSLLLLFSFEYIDLNIIDCVSLLTKWLYRQRVRTTWTNADFVVTSLFVSRAGAPCGQAEPTGSCLGDNKLISNRLFVRRYLRICAKVWKLKLCE